MTTTYSESLDASVKAAQDAARASYANKPQLEDLAAQAAASQAAAESASANASSAASDASAAQASAAASAALVGAPAKSAMDAAMGGDVAGLVPAVNGKVSKGDLVINVKDYGALGNGVADDSAAIQSAITAAAVSGRPARVWLPEGVYRLVSSVVIPAGRGLSLEGDGEGRTIINAALPGVTYPAMATVIDTQLSYRAGLNAVTPTADLAATSRTIPVTDASAARVGDLVYINTSLVDPDTSGYTLGAYRVVTSISGNTLTVDEPLDRDYPLATAAPVIRVCVPHAGTRIGRFTMNLVKGASHRGINLQAAVGGLIHEVTINGNGTRNEGAAGDSSMGVYVEGQNVRVERCTMRDFQESTNSYGYGICLAGNGNVASRNRLERCKHGVAAGQPTRRSKGIIITENVAIDAQLEAHPSCTDALISNNVVTVTNDPAYGTGSGIWVRAHRTVVVGNTVRCVKATGVATTIGGIRIIGAGWDRAVIANNLVFGGTYGIYTGAGDVAANKLTGLAITGNVVSVEGRGVSLVAGAVGCVISDNVIDAGGYGLSGSGMAESVIEGNRIKYGSLEYGIGIEVNPANVAGDTATYEGLSISGNVVTYANSGGAGVNGGLVRLFGKLNRIAVTGNVINSNGSGTEQAQISSLDAVATVVSITGNTGNLGAELRQGATAAPTTGYHRAGETVPHSAPAEAGTAGAKYVITGWVCTVAGTPGTWLPVRSLTGN